MDIYAQRAAALTQLDDVIERMGSLELMCTSFTLGPETKAGAADALKLLAAQRDLLEAQVEELDQACHPFNPDTHCALCNARLSRCRCSEWQSAVPVSEPEPEIAADILLATPHGRQVFRATLRGTYTVAEALEALFCACNGHPNAGDEQLSKSYYAACRRSMSVGDHVRIGGETWRCADIGWTLVAQSVDSRAWFA